MASTYNVTIKQGYSETVTIKTTSDVESVKYSIADTNICWCSWGKWSGNSTTLTINGKSPGTTNVTVTNSENSDKAVIKVTVEPAYTVVCKNDLPASYVYARDEYSGLDLMSRTRVNSISYDYDSTCLSIMVDCTVTYVEPNTYNDTSRLKYTVTAPNGEIVDSGVIQKTDVVEGLHYVYYIRLYHSSHELPCEGEYTITFSNDYR